MILYAFLLVVLWVAVSGIPPFSNLFLVIFSFWLFFDWLKYLGTLFRLRLNGKYICGWVILKTEREGKRKKQTTEQRRMKRRKKGEELEGKDQVLPEGGLSAATVIVGVQPLMH